MVPLVPHLQNLVEEKDKKVKELQDNIAAVSFTPQSKMGKMLMAKCRTLQEENEEIGNQAAEGKVCNHVLLSLSILHVIVPYFFYVVLMCSLAVLMEWINIFL